MSLVRARELREGRARKWERQKELIDAAAKAKRSMNSEENAEFDRIQDELAADLKEAERLERHAATGDEFSRSTGTVAGGQTADEPKNDEARAKRASELRMSAFAKYLRSGRDAEYTDEERELARASANEVRAMSLGTDAAGGYLAPPEAQAAITKATLEFGGIRASRVRVVTTDHGRDLPFPCLDDTANEGALASENTDPGNATDLAYDMKTVFAYKYTTKLILVPRELLQDSIYNVVTEISQALGTRMGRILNRHFTTGNGASQPEGIVNFSTLGKTGASSTAITYNELLDLKHSFDPSYRLNAEFMFNDATLLLLKKLKDGEGRPLWQAGMTAGAPDRIDGSPYVINQNMASMTSGAKSVLYGAMNAYLIRDVSGTVLRRLDERFATSDQVGFIGFERHDGKLLDAGTHPIKHFANA